MFIGVRYETILDLFVHVQIDRCEFSFMLSSQPGNNPSSPRYCISLFSFSCPQMVDHTLPCNIVKETNALTQIKVIQDNTYSLMSIGMA